MQHDDTLEQATALTGEPVTDRFAAKLRALRAQREWSLSRLAAATDLSKAYVSRLELGERQPSLPALVALARAYGLSVGDLVDEEPLSENITRTGSFDWNADGGTPYGRLVGGSGVIDADFSFDGRTLAEGSSPEEMVACAQAACAAMSLNTLITAAGYEPRAIGTRVSVTMEVFDNSSGILQSIDIELRADVPGMSATEFGQLAQRVSRNSTIAKALAVDIHIGSTLVG
ncbi:helix-turn-helix domain-containing protein [Herbiconiux sp.]|uniref:helix-turn-helix domain-containing protein n=1 Tax=Herbiconiux sp. TaxID=1871186 RepID=UPI0025BE7DD6|nr:helix-turn-helix domain-containing protein [Herbiconiux sp.]